MFNNIGFRRQLSIVFSVGIVVLALATTVVVSGVSTKAMRERIINEGKQISEALAEQSTLALLYGSEDNAAEAVEILSAFEDVVAIGVYFRDLTLLYQKGQMEKIDSRLVPMSGKTISVTALDEVWQFIAPVTVNHDDSPDPLSSNSDEAEIIGYVGILISKRSLREMAANIFSYNLFVSLGFAAILLVILMLVARRLLRPINHLASVMSAAQKGERVKQVNMHGPPDIQKMFEAFNTMLGVIERRELELEKSRDEAVQLAHIKSEFAANVSHELRTPMNGVLGMLEMLEDSALTGKEREYLVVARNSARALLTLINDILDFSKNEAGKALLETEEFNLFDQVEEIVALLGTQTQKKKIDFAYILDPELPRQLIGDANRVRQLLINLGSNAIKFTDQGIVSIRVECLVETRTEATLKFSIRDTGIGIPEDKQAHIFEAFSQADGSTTRKFGGTGLGLSICKQLVEMMGGQIGVDSRIGEGSCFWFSLTFNKQQDAHFAKDDPTEPEIRVLVAESNKLLGESLTSMLARCGQQADVVDNFQSALEAIELAGKDGKPVELLVLNENMGQELNEKLVEAARKVREKTVCVVLSLGVRDFNVEENKCIMLAKPVLFSHLMMAVRAAGTGSGKIDSMIEPDTEVVKRSREEELVFPRASVLVVDDNPVNQLVALGLLEPMKCQTDTAINGVECLSRVKQKPFDVILMDCNMPEMDGYKASQKIRSEEGNDEHVVIIAITANAGPGDRQKCIAAGMDDYLVKPFNRDDLKAKLMRWIPQKAELTCEY